MSKWNQPHEPDEIEEPQLNHNYIRYMVYREGQYNNNILGIFGFTTINDIQRVYQAYRRNELFIDFDDPNADFLYAERVSAQIPVTDGVWFFSHLFSENEEEEEE